MVNPWNSARIECIGGPVDGRIVTIATGHMGSPPYHVRIPVALPITLRSLDQQDHTYLPANHALYELSGALSEDKHTWPYTYRGMR